MNVQTFQRYIGIDYSGAETPESSCRGLRGYAAEATGKPILGMYIHFPIIGALVGLSRK